MTPAEKVIQAALAWEPEMQSMAVSMKSAIAMKCGYRQIFWLYKGEPKLEPGVVFMQLRASEPTVIELETLIAYPGEHGLGTKALTALCELCDKEGVTMWCEFSPYGSDRTPPSVEKLQEWYHRFGFYVVIGDIKEEWYTPLHTWRGSSDNLLMRDPKPKM